MTTEHISCAPGSSINRASAPDVRCLAPDSAVPGLAAGYYRLVDAYGLYTIEGLMQRCRTRGLAALMDGLGSPEASRASGVMAVKSAGDAAAVLWSGRSNTEGTDD